MEDGKGSRRGGGAHLRLRFRGYNKGRVISTRKGVIHNTRTLGGRHCRYTSYLPEEYRYHLSEFFIYGLGQNCQSLVNKEEPDTPMCEACKLRSPTERHVISRDSRVFTLSDDVVEKSIFGILKSPGQQQRVIWEGEHSNLLFNPQERFVELPYHYLFA